MKQLPLDKDTTADVMGIFYFLDPGKAVSLVRAYSCIHDCSLEIACQRVLEMGEYFGEHNMSHGKSYWIRTVIKQAIVDALNHLKTSLKEYPQFCLEVSTIPAKNDAHDI